MHKEYVTPTEIRRPRRRAAALLALLVLAGSACDGDGGESIKGGCDAYTVYAQNRWDPLGAAVREQPALTSTKLEPGYAGNEAIAVDGWLDTKEPVYPTNTPPWNSGVWLRLANRKGWVSFPGVRGAPTAPDPTHGYDPDGGQPAPLPDDCQLTRNG